MLIVIMINIYVYKFTVHQKTKLTLKIIGLKPCDQQFFFRLLSRSLHEYSIQLCRAQNFSGSFVKELML